MHSDRRLSKRPYDPQKECGSCPHLSFLYGAIALFGVSNSDPFSYIVVFLGTMLPVTVMTYDERAGWNQLALFMLLARWKLVCSKYLRSIFIYLAVGARNTMVQGSRLTVGNLVVAGGTILSADFLITAFVMPLLFWFGVKKERLMMLGIILLPPAVYLLLTMLEIPITLNSGQMMQLLLWLPVAAVTATVLSCFVSIWIVRRKEY
ncbi:MAG: ABC-2 transporter permease [Oscillospiraceae bacterium]|jgi:ABC-2 type transport system permease protein